MKKAMIWLLCFTMLLIVGCSPKPAEPYIVSTIESPFATYYEMSDGTWQAEGITYQYRLEITGRMHNAAVDSTFVYLSNLENISFDRAWKAAGLSSRLSDYFAPEEAILVDWQTGN
ncbi:MAG: immunogenic protein [Ruminococcaceae bacterium]|nr:immunogenic protein [Oscillospiraceae bacterium]